MKFYLECCSLELNECIKPIDYANIVYAMFSDFLVREYKKTVKGMKTKDIVDKYKNGMDYALIEKFEYPASFENQKYLYDTEGGLECISTEGVCAVIERPTNIPADIEKEYKCQTK